MNEEIVDGPYMTKEDADKEKIDVSYSIKGFPVAYTKVDHSGALKIDDALKKGEKEIYGFEKDTKHFRVSGADFAKAYLKDTTIKEETKHDIYDYSYEFYISLPQPASYDIFERDCDDLREFINDHTITDPDERKEQEEKSELYNVYDVCKQSTHSYYYILNLKQENYADRDRGKIEPEVKKYLTKRSRKNLQDVWEIGSPLYEFAIMSLVIQILAIVIWAVGRFIGGFGGGNDQKSPSEGEA